MASKSGKLSSSLSSARDDDDKQSSSSSSSRTSSGKTNKTAEALKTALGSSSSYSKSDPAPRQNTAAGGSGAGGAASAAATSTWRDSNSGWSGSTASARLSDDQVRDTSSSSRGRGRSTASSDRDRAPEPDRWDGPIPTRDQGDEFEGPALQGRDTPLVSYTGDTGAEVWTPTSGRPTEPQPFTSPVWNWVSDQASRGVGYLEQVQENYDNSGVKRNHDDRTAERNEWYEEAQEAGGWRAVGANIATPFLAATQAAEMASDFLFAVDMPDSPATITKALGQRIQGEEPEEDPSRVTVGQWLSAAGQASNRKYNVLSSDFEGATQWANANIGDREDWSGSWWNIFQNSIEDSREVNERIDALPPEAQHLVSPVYNMLHTSGPERQSAAIDSVLFQSENVAELRRLSEQALANGQAADASMYYSQAEDLMSRTALDIVDEYKNVAGDLMAKISMPDVTDFIAGPVLAAGAVSAKKVKAMLASDITEMGAEAATEVLKKAVGDVSELARVVDEASGGDMFRFWKGKTNPIKLLFENTRATEAQRVAANFVDSVAVVLPRAQTADEAKVLLRSLFDGTLFEKNPSIGRNPFLDPSFLDDMKVFGQAEDLILSAKTLNDPDAYNPLLVLGELEDIIWRRSRQLFGLDSMELPTGTVRVKTRKVDRKANKHVVEWIGADGSVLKTTDVKKPMLAAEATKMKKEQQALVEEGLSKPWYFRVGDWQRAVLSTMYLNLAPRHWVRNAIASYSAMTVDDALNITKLDNMGVHITDLYGGGAPSSEWGSVLRGNVVDPTKPETMSGVWTLGGRWKKNNPFAWLDSVGNKTWTGTTEIPVPGTDKALPVGEEAFRVRIAYQRMMQYLNHGMDSLTEDFAAGLRDLNVDPEIASSLVGKFSDLGRNVDRTKIFEAMREAIGSPELAGTLDEIGIAATQTTPQGRAKLVKILQESSLDDRGALFNRLMGWLKEETGAVSRIIENVPPQPGRQFFTTMSQAEDAAEGIESLIYYARKAGQDAVTARKTAEDLWRGVVDSERAAMQSIQDVIANTEGTGAYDRAYLFFRRIEQEKRKVRLLVDRLNKNAAISAREGKDVWGETMERVSKEWQDFGANLQTWVDDFANATVSRTQPRAAIVGETVILDDGTEAVVKQYIANNGLESYVVNPKIAPEIDPRLQGGGRSVLIDDPDAGTMWRVTNVEKADDAPSGYRVWATDHSTTDQATEVLDDALVQRHLDNTPMPSGAGTVSDVEKTVNARTVTRPNTATEEMAERAAADTEDLLKRYLDFDAEENARLREMGVSASSDDVTWSKVIDAGRQYADQALNDSLLFFRRAPSQDFFDHMVSAEQEINETGMWVASQVARIRDDWFSGLLDRAAYYKKGSELWRQYWEFAHQRYRFATHAGLRASLGDEVLDIMSDITTMHVPPQPDLDDIRRLAGLTGRGTNRGPKLAGDKRLINSIKSHFKISLNKLDDLTPDQRRTVFAYYLNEAEEKGVDLPKEWYRWRNPDMSGVTGFGPEDNFSEVMWKLESGRLAGGNVTTPTYGDVARYELANAWDTVKKVMDNADRLLAPRANTLDNAQRAGSVRLVNNLLRKWDDTLYNAAKAGEEATSFAMLNYRDRKNIDTVLGMIFPYHYYATRAPINWLKRSVERPGIAYNVWLANQAIRQENQQFDGPMRAEGSVPNPLQNLVGNAGFPNIASKMPSRVYSPIEYAIPYSIWNDFVDPNEGQSRFERMYLNAQRYTPGFQPVWQVLGATLFDAENPRGENSWSRMADYQVGDYVPLARMGGYLAQGLTGKQIHGQLGDQFDFGRVSRAIRTGIAAGDYERFYAELAIGQIENQMRGYAPIPEMQDPETLAKVQEIVKSGTQAAGMERFSNLAMSYFTGLPGQNVDDLELELRKFQEEYYEAGYSYENPMGSATAREQMLERELSTGVEFGDANLYYSDLYEPGGSDYGPRQVQAVTKQFYKERSAIYDEMREGTIDFLLDNPLATDNDLAEFKGTYYQQVEALKEKFPSADIAEPSRDAPNTKYMNPFERAQAEIEAVMRYEPPGKPEYPGDDAPENVLDTYKIEKGQWNEKRLNYLERVFEQWVQGDDTIQGAKENDFVIARTAAGRYAQELLDAYELRYASPVEIEHYMTNQMRGEAIGSGYRQQDAAVQEQFGDDGFALYQEFEAIPKRVDEDGNNRWTDQHYQFLDDNPEVEEMRLYAKSPDAYDKMLDMGGERVFEALAAYPGGGTKQEKKQWRSRYSKEADAVYWWFGENDNIQTPVDLGFEKASVLYADPWSYDGPRPIGSAREPIGGIGREEYEAAAGVTEDYTGMRPQDAIDASAIQRGETSPPEGVPPMIGSPDGVPGLSAPPAGSAAEVLAARMAEDAASEGKLLQYVDARQEAIANLPPREGGSSGSSSGGGYGGGGGGYWYRGRWYRSRRYRRRGYRRGGRRRRRGGYRRYGRGGRRSGRRYYGGGGGGYSTVDEGQELFLDLGGTPQIGAREFSSWLMRDDSGRQPWRPTGISRGFTPARSPEIRAWRRIPVRR